jgi:formylglycine-generating enzyme required for sulfatase activity
MIGICSHCQQMSPMLRRCDNKACGFMYCMSCASLTVFCPRCGSSGTVGGWLDNIKGVNDPPPEQRLPPTVDPQRPHPVPQGPGCPHCGGKLPSDGPDKKYRLCMHCRSPLFWHGGRVYATEQEVQALVREFMTRRQRQRDSLLSDIRDNVAPQRLDGLIAAVDEYLSEVPNDSEMLTLRQSLLDRDATLRREITSHFETATQYIQACRFNDAVKEFERIPEAWRDADIIDSLDRCRTLEALRQKAFFELKKPEAIADDAAIRAGHEYRAALAITKAKDPKFEQLLAKAEAPLLEASRKRTRRTLIVVVIGLAVGGLWFRSTMRVNALQTAITNSRWDEALKLDPRNVAALLGRARGKLTASSPDVDGAFSDIAKAEEFAADSPEAKAARGIAYAVRATRLAMQGKISDAAKDLAEAVKLGAETKAVDEANEAMIAAWLARATKAIESHDTKALKAACDAAAKAGADAEVVKTLRAKGTVLKAQSLLKAGKSQSAVAMVKTAMDEDAMAACEMMKKLESSDLLAVVAKQSRMEIEGALAKKDWQTFFKLGPVVRELLREESSMWLGEALKTLPADAWATMPAEVMAAVPAEVMSALPNDVLLRLPASVLLTLPPLVNSIGMQLKLIPAGRFTMGQAGGRGFEETRVQVTLTEPFYIGVHEVTNAHWKRVMGSVTSLRKDEDLPVEGVNWWGDAIEFCRKLSELPAERQAGRVYRLPTEAEWECACRAGTTTAYSFGDDEKLLGDFCWFDGNSGNAAHPVGTKKPNPWGLHDMHGNVWEWCSDWYDFKLAGGVDPNGPARGSDRVCRGGGWRDRPMGCQSAARSTFSPSLGFRVARSQSKPQADVKVKSNTASEPSAETLLLKTVANSAGITLLEIPAGKFRIGKEPSTAAVTLTQPFWLGKTEVTRGQWQQVMGTEPWGGSGDTSDTDLPAVEVSWGDAMEFCRKLTDRERSGGKLQANEVYRLPTEAEWEYACRAGTTTAYSFGDEESKLDDFGWFVGNSKRKAWFVGSSGGKVHPVGTKKPNPWGLHDMHGNVREWCSDWYQANLAGGVDPEGPVGGSYRVYRGGSWRNDPVDCRSAHRNLLDPSRRIDDLGFRVARSQSVK